MVPTIFTLQINNVKLKLISTPYFIFLTSSDLVYYLGLFKDKHYLDIHIQDLNDKP